MLMREDNLEARGLSLRDWGLNGEYSDLDPPTITPTIYPIVFFEHTRALLQAQVVRHFLVTVIF